MESKAIPFAYEGKSQAEWDRLHSTPYARIEYFITRYCLERYLPACGFVLDAGSGPGRYAIHLAQQGYQIAMLDYVYEMLCLGREKIEEVGMSGQITSLIQGDISALPYPTDTFDAVISLGAPLSHLLEHKQRVKAISEMVRVLKPHGCLLITGLTRISLYRAMVYWMNEDLFRQYKSGEIKNQGVFHGWIKGYAFQPGELAALLKPAGIEILNEVGCEGIAAHLPLEHLERIEKDPELWAIWKEILRETCDEPSTVGISNHLLLVGRKRDLTTTS